MKLIPPLLGYALKGLCYPLEYVASQKIFAPPTPDIKVIRDQAYGAHPLQKLDIYSKTSVRNIRPVIIFVHGGGWIAGDKTIFHAVCQRLAAQDYLVCNINYRLAPQYLYAQQIQDVGLALKWVVQNCALYQGDRHCLFLAGDSSGANLIMNYTIALSHPYLRNALNIRPSIGVEQLKGLLLLFGIFDLAEGLFSFTPIARRFNEIFLGSTQENYAEWVDLASPLRHLHTQIPPLFIAAGEVDPLFSQSVLLAQKLKLMQHEYATCFFSKTQHPDALSIFFSFLHKTYAQEILKEANLFLHFFSNHHRLSR